MCLRFGVLFFFPLYAYFVDICFFIVWYNCLFVILYLGFSTVIDLKLKLANFSYYLRNDFLIFIFDLLVICDRKFNKKTVWLEVYYHFILIH